MFIEVTLRVNSQKMFINIRNIDIVMPGDNSGTQIIFGKDVYVVQEPYFTVKQQIKDNSVSNNYVKIEEWSK